MKSRHLGVVVTTLFLVLTVLRADAAEQRTLTGRFMSGYQNGEKPVKAVFLPLEDGSWNVEFYFKFNGHDHIYRGTAEGSLSEGALKGKVVNESRQRTFVFLGEFKAGKFTGRHAEIKRRGERQTGTITLSD